MYHYMEFDPYFIREHNEELRNEVSKLRLETRLRGDKARGSRPGAFTLLLKSSLHPLRRASMAGR